MVGLGTMGRNLLLNIAEKGYPVSGLDTDAGKVDLLHQERGALQAEGFTDAAAFVASLRKPRPVMILVPAGPPVDSVIASLSAHLEAGDMIIDGGNSYFKDTTRRAQELAAKNLGFMGIGVSGGESGARHGPSMMAGGTEKDYDRVKSLLEAVAAHANGEPCVALLGSGAAGHYVKMVHNGIEYAVMQLISEAYDMMKRGLGMENAEIATVFDGWSKNELAGFLIEITATVLKVIDPDTGKNLVDLVSDHAKQKGTGKWASQDAMDLTVPIPTIDAAVSMRDLSGYKEERVAASKQWPPSSASFDKTETIQQLRQALDACFFMAYAQGLALLKRASTEYGFGLSNEKVVAVWRAGCIIRAASLEPIRAELAANPELPNLLASDKLRARIAGSEASIQRVIGKFLQAKIPAPGIMASVSYLHGYFSERLPTNLIQAQRDFFGAHGYERIDKPGSFHTEWGA